MGLKATLRRCVRGYLSEPLAGWRPVERDGRSEGDTFVVRTFVVPAPVAAMRGQRIAFFSDLHWFPPETCSVAEALVEAVRCCAPDWVLFGGDLTRYLADLTTAFGVLSRLHGRLGNIAVCGNWERQHHWRSAADWKRRYADAGFRLLVNERYVSEDGAVFVGLDEPRCGMPDIEAATTGKTVPGIWLVHSPDVVGTKLAQRMVGLLLSGHTHGGQFRLPGLGALYTSSRYGKQFEYGWFERQDGLARMLVSAGVGVTGRGVLRRRLACPPEVVCLELT